MDPEDDVRAILTGAAGGPQPPMRLEAADVVERGGRVRRRRKRLAVAGTSTATAVILAVAGFLAGHRAGPPQPVEPAGPGLSTIGTTSPASPTARLPVPAPSMPPSVAPKGTSPRSPRTSVPQQPSLTRPTNRSTPTTALPSAGPAETRTSPPTPSTSK
jgi:hypothetical protein